MARFTAQVNVGENLNVTYKITGAVDDNDLNKPVKITATDEVVLCSDGDEIYGFINSVERHTADGKVIVGVQIAGRRKVTLDGAAAVGSMVEAAANTAVGTALGQNWGIVSAHVLDDTTATTLMNSIFNKNWVVISGAGTDGTDALIELQ